MMQAKVNNKNFEIEPVSTDPLRMRLNGVEWEIDMEVLGENRLHVIVDGRSYSVSLVSNLPGEKTYVLKINGHTYSVNLKDRFDLLLEKMGLSELAGAQVNDIKAPMPGMVLKVNVQKGAEVKSGDPLLLLEAMKMENVLKAPADGVVSEVLAKEGKTVEKNQVLLTFES